MTELTELEGTKLMLKRCQQLWKEDMIGRYHAEQELKAVRTILETKSTLYNGDEMDKLEDCESRIELALQSLDDFFEDKLDKIYSDT